MNDPIIEQMAEAHAMADASQVTPPVDPTKVPEEVKTPSTSTDVPPTDPVFVQDKVDQGLV